MNDRARSCWSRHNQISRKIRPRSKETVAAVYDRRIRYFARIVWRSLTAATEKKLARAIQLNLGAFGGRTYSQIRAVSVNFLLSARNHFSSFFVIVIRIMMEKEQLFGAGTGRELNGIVSASMFPIAT